MKIPLMDIQAQYFSVKNEIDEAVAKVMQQAQFVGGTEKESFEKEFSKALKIPHTVGVGNGTDAIFLVLRSLGIGAGDEVITAANSFIASSEAITAAGARVVFCDVDEKTSLIDLEKLEDLLKRKSHKFGGRVKAILPVYLYGRIMNMDSLMALAKTFDVAVVEDAAQAHLAKWDGKFAGSFGVAGTFSFYPGKNLGAFGDAGAVVTTNKEIALKIRKLADHGRISKYDHDIEGFNSRLDTIQAAVLRVKLRHLEKWTKLRQEKARNYDALLKTFTRATLPEIPPKDEHVFHIYAIRIAHRDDILKKMQAQNIFPGVHYPIALPFLKAYNYLHHRPEDFPVAFKLQQEILSLPLYPEMTDEMQDLVVSALKEASSR